MTFESYTQLFFQRWKVELGEIVYMTTHLHVALSTGPPKKYCILYTTLTCTRFPGHKIKKKLKKRKRKIFTPG